MVNRLTINGKTLDIIKFPDVEERIIGELRTWVTFDPSTTIEIKVEQIPDPSALAVDVKDEIDLVDRGPGQ